MRIGRNLAVGLFNSAWSAVVSLAVVPLYLRYLGIENYGLIGFFVTIQALFQLLDMGMGPTMNREVARCTACDSLHEARTLLSTLEIIYWGMAVAILCIVLLLSPFISQHWLQSKNLSPETITHVIILMGVVVAARWPVGLYQGALMGAHRLAISGGINIVIVTIGSLGAVLVLAFLSPTIEAFFIWQVGVGLVYALVMRKAARRVLGVEKSSSFDWSSLKRVWKFSASMSFIALLGGLFTQMDKLILSKLLGLVEFGQYMLAALVVSSLYILVIPVFNVVYPRFTDMVSKGQTTDLISFYRLSTRILATVLFPVALLLILNAQELVTIWTGNEELAVSVGPVIALLAAGSALHGIMYFPYALQLAFGETRIPIVILITLMLVLTPLTIYLTMSFGSQGAAMAWLLLHVFYMIIGTWLTHRRLLKGLGLAWLFQDIGTPLVVTAIVGMFGTFLVLDKAQLLYERVGFGVLLVLTATTLSTVLSSKMRILVLNKLGLSKNLS